MPNYNSGAFSIISIITTNEHYRENIRCLIVSEPSHLRKLFWCLYPKFDCQFMPKFWICQLVQPTVNPILANTLGFHDKNKLYGRKCRRSPIIAQFVSLAQITKNYGVAIWVGPDFGHPSRPGLRLRRTKSLTCFGRDLVHPEIRPVQARSKNGYIP